MWYAPEALIISSNMGWVEMLDYKAEEKNKKNEMYQTS